MVCIRVVGFIPDLKGRGILLDRKINVWKSKIKIMSGSYERHVDEFGFCNCGNRTGIEMMNLEVEVGHGRYRFEQMPACDSCFGLL